MADDIAQVVQIEMQGMTMAIKGTVQVAEWFMQAIKALMNYRGEKKEEKAEKKKKKQERRLEKAGEKRGIADIMKLSENIGVPQVVNVPEEHLQEFLELSTKNGARFCQLVDLDATDGKKPIFFPPQDLIIADNILKNFDEKDRMKLEQDKDKIEKEITELMEKSYDAAESEKVELGNRIDILNDEVVEIVDMRNDILQGNAMISFEEYLLLAKGTEFEKDPDKAISELEQGVELGKSLSISTCLQPIRYIGKIDNIELPIEKIYSFTEAVDNTFMKKEESVQIFVNAVNPEFMAIIITQKDAITIQIAEKDGKILKEVEVIGIKNRNARDIDDILCVQRDYGFSDNIVSYDSIVDAKKHMDSNIVHMNKKIYYYIPDFDLTIERDMWFDVRSGVVCSNYITTNSFGEKYEFSDQGISKINWNEGVLLQLLEKIGVLLDTPCRVFDNDEKLEAYLKYHNQVKPKSEENIEKISEKENEVFSSADAKVEIMYALSQDLKAMASATWDENKVEFIIPEDKLHISDGYLRAELDDGSAILFQAIHLKNVKDGKCYLSVGKNDEILLSPKLPDTDTVSLLQTSVANIEKFMKKKEQTDITPQDVKNRKGRK